MSKEKQIEEMAKDIPSRIVAYNSDPKGQHLYIEQRKCVAEALYNAGYRKQSELTPCDCCRFNPPSSGDGKPCSICPAQAK